MRISISTVVSLFQSYGRLMRLDRPVGILLLLWPTLWALWIAARGVPSIKILLVFMAGVVLMRAAGCIINDWADREWDGHVERTRWRPFPQGQVNSRGAITLFVIVCLLAAALLLLLNPLTAWLAVLGFLLTLIYPFTKRYLHLPQVVLGLAFAWGVPMAFAAQTNHVPKIAWFLFLLTALWTIVYDTEYAMVDRPDDMKIGIKSMAILLGRYDRVTILALQCTVWLGLLYMGIQLALRIDYYVGLLAVALLMGYQHYLIRDRQPARCFRAFLNNQWIGMVIFAGIFLSYWGS
ncbi:MAG: 4-hydroxybenzoate polyprenyltransferase [Coxiella sp. RIFCSPHIGHO2_12_FULL_44_14]|nr:MAG: 4-hydroxybenzoate polyprenyltransferase [Coxiella sp. RIFCSPHIGHO2_12_FULL_44_14]